MNGAHDIAGAWLAHYRSLGVTAFHLILHGPPEANREILALRTAFPIVICETYEGLFSEREKIRRLNQLLVDLRGQWVVVVDNDEFLETPYPSLRETIHALTRCASTALSAPLLHRLRADGSLDSPAVVPDPFDEFPLCSIALYRALGTAAAVAKYPLFRVGPDTRLRAGNHSSPNGPASALSPLRGVSHHFKWRRPLHERLQQLIGARATYGYWHESAAILEYLEAHAFRLPLEDAFPYSRAALFRRSLLAAAAWPAVVRHRLGRLVDRLPPPLARRVVAAAQRLTRGR